MVAALFFPHGRSLIHLNSPGADTEHVLESSFLWAIQPLKCLKSLLTLQNTSQNHFIPVGLATKGDGLLISSGEALCLRSRSNFVLLFAQDNMQGSPGTHGDEPLNHTGTSPFILQRNGELKRQRNNHFFHEAEQIRQRGKIHSARQRRGNIFT